MEYATLDWYNDEEKQKQFIENLAPIVLFTYNRLEHTKQAIEALQQNIYACSSNLYIYSDAAKNETMISDVNAVRNYFKKIDGFKSITIIERENNWGLAKNIIDGVTNIVNRYGKIIVLEDDIVTSKYFLKYMNDALEIYKNKKQVMQITGYIYPIKTDDLPETFFLKLTSSWGWATWEESWSLFERNPEKLISSFSKDEIQLFNLDGTTNFWEQVLLNHTGQKHTWAIFWYVTVFKNNGLVLHSRIPLNQNIGFDGSGENCGESSQYDVSLLNKPVQNFTLKISDNAEAKERIKSTLMKINTKSLYKKLFIFIKNFFKVIIE